MKDRKRWMIGVLLTRVFCFFLGGVSGFSQGNIRFGFEEYDLHSVPPLVKPDVINGISYIGYTSDSTLPPYTIAAYEGGKFLRVGGSVLLRSPDAAPIHAFSLRLFMPGDPSAPPNFLSFQAGDTRGRAEQSGSWQLLTGSFASPVSEFAVSAFIREGQILPAVFGVDDVRLTTVPEPRILTLLGMGACAGMALWWRRKSNQSNAIAPRVPVTVPTHGWDDKLEDKSRL